ncbi:MAG: A/G-specific adenine glycosylase [Bdellovibrionales bacterium]
MKADQNNLLKWYKKNYREFPWRETEDPYKIWISEIMLQQTRATAVVPIYNRFLKKFPSVSSLANSPTELVMEYWAGLGYYSRARNIHKSAKIIKKNGFPNNHLELLELPGLGPYTARAIASFAFGEKVGVLDGNVIRFLSRFHSLPLEWWKTPQRNQLQVLADEFANHSESQLMNQALIEIGASICLPKNPACNICPLSLNCNGRKDKTIDSLPLKKAKRKEELWQCDLKLYINSKQQIALVKNPNLPFLKSHWVFPGKAKKLEKKPVRKSFSEHSITHHKIYASIETKPKSSWTKKDQANYGEITWVSIKDVKKKSPTSLTQKLLKQADFI